MRRGSREVVWGVAGTALLWVTAVALTSGQGAPRAELPRDVLAENVFKNVTVLRGISTDEFMGTMGVFSAATGMNCTECHVDNGTWEGYGLDDKAPKRTARRMVTMMAELNKQYFGGRQVVTCYSCHRGGNRPRVTPSIMQLYSPVTAEELDVLLPPALPGTPTAEQILDTYLQALGGVQRLAGLTSYIARGTYAGYGPEKFPRPVEIWAKAPNQKTAVLRDPTSGDNVTVFDGRSGWISAPFRPVDVLQLHGAELDAARAEAELTFPANIKQALTNLRSSRDFINDRTVLAVQGNKGNALVTMYFEEDTGLLSRLVRSTPSPVGRVVVQTDYSDYREVAGVRLPFKWTTSWFDGRTSYELTDVQPNAAIDAGRFAKPGPPKPY